MATPCVNVEDFIRPLQDSLSQIGFELYPFKVCWYNTVLPAALHLPHHDDTLAVLLISTPEMFERAFLPFLEKHSFQTLSDPIDQCVKHQVTSAVTQCFPGQQVEVRFDYEMLPSRKPKFLAQTAAHVSGAAYYYQQADVPDQPWGSKKVYGVCVHPRLGGWFAVRALLLFPGVQVDLQQTPPPDCVPSRDARIRLLDDFNLHWQDWSYRNIVDPVQTYSQKQREYFSLPPPQRAALLQGWGYIPGGGSLQDPPAPNLQDPPASNLQDPPASSSSLQDPPASSSSLQDPPASSSSLQDPPAPSSSLEDPPAHSLQDTAASKTPTNL